MGSVLYIHRLSKLIDEMVKELGLTVSLSDDLAKDVKLGDHIQNLDQLALSLGVSFQHQVQANGSTIIVFRPR
jgi:hypothetical protein